MSIRRDEFPANKYSLNAQVQAKRIVNRAVSERDLYGCDAVFLKSIHYRNYDRALSKSAIFLYFITLCFSSLGFYALQQIIPLQSIFYLLSYSLLSFRFL